MTPSTVVAIVALVQFAVLLAYHSPALLARVGCWLTAWAESRETQRREHAAKYRAMLAERGLEEPKA